MKKNYSKPGITVCEVSIAGILAGSEELGLYDTEIGTGEIRSKRHRFIEDDYYENEEELIND